jgi:hypothetical protein
VRTSRCFGSRAEPSQSGDGDRQEQVFHRIDGMHRLRRGGRRFIRPSGKFLLPDFQR